MQYGLFRRPRNSGKGHKWEQVSDLMLPRHAAVCVFQNRLLGPYLDPNEYQWTYVIRPDKRPVDSKMDAKKERKCADNNR